MSSILLHGYLHFKGGVSDDMFDMSNIHIYPGTDIGMYITTSFKFSCRLCCYSTWIEYNDMFDMSIKHTYVIIIIIIGGR